MAYTVTRTTTRPRIDVEYFEYPSGFIDRWKDNGSVILTESLDSINGFTRTRVTIWKTEDAYKLFAADAITISLAAQRDEYNAAHGITMSLEFTNS